MNNSLRLASTLLIAATVGCATTGLTPEQRKARIQQNQDEAIAEAELLIVDAPDWRKAELLHRQGELLRMRGRYAEANVRFERVLAEFDSYAKTDEVLLRAAEMDERTGDFQGALRHLSKLVNGYPESQFVATAYATIGDLLYADGQIELATTAFEYATQHPGDPDAAEHANRMLAELTR